MLLTAVDSEAVSTCRDNLLVGRAEYLILYICKKYCTPLRSNQLDFLFLGPDMSQNFLCALANKNDIIEVLVHYYSHQ